MDTIYIDALLSNDTQRVREVYRRFAPKVKRYVLHNSGSEADADDVFQRSLIAVYEKALREGSAFLTVPFEAYLLRIAQLQWLKQLRDTRIKLVSNENTSSDTVINDDDAVSMYKNNSAEPLDANIEEQWTADETRRERNAHLWRQFAQLPDYCQKLLQLRIIDELTNPQIAEREAQTLNYVTSRISMCLKRLRELF